MEVYLDLLRNTFDHQGKNDNVTNYSPAESRLSVKFKPQFLDSLLNHHHHVWTRS